MIVDTFPSRFSFFFLSFLFYLYIYTCICIYIYKYIHAGGRYCCGYWIIIQDCWYCSFSLLFSFLFCRVMILLGLLCSKETSREWALRKLLCLRCGAKKATKRHSDFPELDSAKFFFWELNNWLFRRWGLRERVREKKRESTTNTLHTHSHRERERVQIVMLRVVCVWERETHKREMVFLCVLKRESVEKMIVPRMGSYVRDRERYRERCHLCVCVCVHTHHMCVHTDNDSF